MGDMDGVAGGPAVNVRISEGRSWSATGLRATGQLKNIKFLGDETRIEKANHVV